jgi:hypothetical protein
MEDVMKKAAFIFLMVCILAACTAPTQMIQNTTSTPVSINTLQQPESSTTLPPTLEPDGKPVYQMSFITYAQDIYRLWVVNSDGSGLKLLHPPLDWRFQLEPTLPE